MKTLDWHINQNGLSNHVLSDLLKHLSVNNQYYKGVFPFDNIPVNLCSESNFIIIVNIGLHFVTVYAQPNFVLYIDSLGNSSPPNMRDFLYQCKRPVFFNERQIQSFSSTHCGFFSVLFVIFFVGKKKGIKIESFKFRDTNLKFNDKLCTKYIKLIGHQMIVINKTS